MSSDPIDTPEVPTTAPAPVADFVAANRGPVAIALILIGIVCLTVAGYCLTRAFNAPKAEQKADDPTAEAAEIADPNRPAYLVGTVLAVLGAAVGVGVGGRVLAQLPRPDVAGRRADARVTILLAGVLFGFVLMLAGMWFFYLWFGSLTAWLDDGRRSEAKWVLGPILAFVAGAALVFAAAQPARAEERNNATLRRLVYGANLGLAALLLLLILTVGNVFASLRVPNELDTTASGVYTVELADSTQQLIAGLEQPVTVYSTLYEGAARGQARIAQVVRDSRRLLEAAERVNPAKFHVRHLSLQVDKNEIDRLAGKFPQFDRELLGLLVVVGEDESRASFIPGEDLFTREGQGDTQQVVFQGEGRLVRELLFLTEGQNRPVVYFTQGHGELETTPPPPGPGGRPAGVRTALLLAEALRKNYVDVKPLGFDLADPKVPDDAAVVVVADPTSPLPKEHAEALRRYMTEPRPNDETKKGKLIVLSSPHPRPEDRKGVAQTGLEGLLGEFGVQLGDQYIYNQPGSSLGYNEVITALNAALVESRNPVALALYESQIILPDCRVIEPGEQAGAFQPEPLLLTHPARGTWLEPDPVSNPAQVWQRVRESGEYRTARQYTQRPRAVAVLVSEPPAPGATAATATARVAVFGSGAYFADPEPGARPNPTPPQVFAATLDWLRDRPVVNVANKTYGQYTVKAEPDTARILLLPVGVTLLSIVAVGFGMWVFRQR